MASANFERDELQDIRSRGQDLGTIEQNEFLRMAYYELAAAADKLDAMIARQQTPIAKPTGEAWPTPG